MEDLKKSKTSEWGESVAEKKSDTAILCSSLCSLRGAEQGNMENVLVEKR